MDIGLKRTLRATITVAVLTLAYVMAFALRFEFMIPASFLETLIATLPLVVGLKVALLVALRANRHSWQYTSLDDVIAIAVAMFAAAALLLASRLMLPELFPDSAVAAVFVVPLGVIGIDLALSLLGTAGVRAARRMQVDRQAIRRFGERARDRKRVLLVGAGRVGNLVVKEIAGRPDLNLRLVGFVDDDPTKQRQLINGLEVLGETEDLPRLLDELAIDRVIITIAGASGDAVRRVTDHCHEAGVETQIVPGLHEIVGGKVSLSRIRPVEVEDLLGREPVELDTTSIDGYVRGGTVLVTGAGGSIGSELCRQLVRFEPRELVLVDQSEHALWAIHRELDAEAAEITLVPAIADVCDATRIAQLFAEHRPAVVFHAAAHKHVPMMESNPCEAVKNNVIGTKVVADAAVEHGLAHFVLVSTDKAVNPGSVMGMTKRVAERYVQHLAFTHDRRFVSVRFGNVLGSTGSVVPIFKEQIGRGEPVTITDPEMRRYFMTIPEASQLVIQAAALGEGGEIFVLDMGEPVRIVDLAHDLIRLSGLRPEIDVPVVFTGTRPGEKLFEELSLSIEHADRTKHPKIFTGSNAHPNWATVDDDLGRLLGAAVDGRSSEVRDGLVALIPELRPAGADGATEAAERPAGSPGDGDRAGAGAHAGPARGGDSGAHAGTQAGSARDGDSGAHAGTQAGSARDMEAGTHAGLARDAATSSGGTSERGGGPGTMA